MRRHFPTGWAGSLAALLVAACGPDPDTAAPSARPAPASSDLLLREARLVRVIDGKTVAQVSARELRYQREGGRFAADSVHATLLPGPQARALDSFGAVQVSAPRVSGDSTSNVVRGEGGVSAQAARGDLALGESVVWDGQEKRLSSAQPVSIAGAGYTLRGGALEATTDGSSFELSAGAQGTLARAGSR